MKHLTKIHNIKNLGKQEITYDKVKKIQNSHAKKFQIPLDL